MSPEPVSGQPGLAETGSPTAQPPDPGGSSRPAETARGRAPGVLPAVLVSSVAMLVASVWGLARNDAMSNDEVATRWIAGLSLRQMAHVLRHIDAVHGTYYLLIHFWGSAFGFGVVTIRVPSVIAATLGAGVVAYLTVRLTNSALSGVVAGLMVAISTSVVFYAQTARSFALVYLFVAVATLLLTVGLQRAADPRRPATVLPIWVPYAVVLVIAGYLNELSVLLLLAHGVTVLLTRPRITTFLQWLVASIVAVIVVAPLVDLSSHQTSVIHAPKPDGRTGIVLFHTFFALDNPMGFVMVALTVAGLLPGIGRFASLPRRGDVDPYRHGGGILSVVSVGLPLLVIPTVVLAVYSAVASQSLFENRYVLYCQIGVALIAAAGLTRLASLVRVPALQDWVAPTLVAVIALVAIFAISLPDQDRSRSTRTRVFDFGGPTQFIAEHKQAGDAVLFFDSFYRKARLGYPLRFRHVPDIAMLKSPEKVGNFRGTNKPYDRIARLMLSHQRIWTLGATPVASGTFKFGPSIHGQVLLLRQDFRKIADHHWGPITVTLWQRTSRQAAPAIHRRPREMR